MTLQQFTQRITENRQYLSPETIGYLQAHALRFFETFRTCREYLKPGDRVLSVGAGPGAIEKMLKEECGVEVTLLDFPEAIEEFRDFFDAMGFITVGANLAADQIDLPKAHFQMLLSSEVVEHVPKSPEDQLRKFDVNMAPGGKIVITTPNHGSLMHLAKVAMMMPILESPARFFSPIGMENQGVHRREYFPCELADAFRNLGYRHIRTRFFHYKKAKNFGHRLMYLAAALVPRFKFGMMVIGEKAG